MPNSDLIGTKMNATQQVDKSYISSIKKDNEKYHIKDSEAREAITEVENNVLHMSVDVSQEKWIISSGNNE